MSRRALAALGDGDVAEGGVGAGTGMSCFDFPGGIGTASRRVGEHHGRRPAALQLRRPRVPRPAGRSSSSPAPPADRAPHGSLHRGLRDRRAADRPPPASPRAAAAARAWPGPAPTGRRAPARSGSRSRSPRFRADRPRARSTCIFAAAYEAAHEAVMNCLVAARPGTRLDGTMQDAFPIERRADASAPRGAACERARVRCDGDPAARRGVALCRDLIRIDTSNPPGRETPAARAARRLPARGGRGAARGRALPGRTPSDSTWSRRLAR